MIRSYYFKISFLKVKGKERGRRRQKEGNKSIWVLWACLPTLTNGPPTYNKAIYIPKELKRKHPLGFIPGWLLACWSIVLFLTHWENWVTNATLPLSLSLKVSWPRPGQIQSSLEWGIRMSSWFTAEWLQMLKKERLWQLGPSWLKIQTKFLANQEPRRCLNRQQHALATH